MLYTNEWQDKTILYIQSTMICWFYLQYYIVYLNNKFWRSADRASW